jgi:acyl-CoA reductase-like NAD-dependent aldehyde dehydrogenase
MNGPLGACIWKIGPALATGCTVVLKPAQGYTVGKNVSHLVL